MGMFIPLEFRAGTLHMQYKNILFESLIDLYIFMFKTIKLKKKRFLTENMLQLNTILITNAN